MQPGMPNLQHIVLKAQQMQAEMERAQATLAEAEVTGSAGGGVVTAVATAGGELRSVRIDPAVVDPSDVETLEDLIVAAVHDARRAAEELANRTMGSVAGDLASQLDLSALGLGGLAFPGMGGAIEAADEDEDSDDFDADEYEDADEDDDEDANDTDATGGPVRAADDVIVDDAEAVDGTVVADIALPGDMPPDAPGRGRG
jgi:nucleoid-associated protein EbfC